MRILMLGELLFESKGKITSQRVLSVENGIPKLEISIAGTGIFTGSQEVTTTWTYWVIQRPDGTSYSQGQGVLMTKDGRDVATATGRTRYENFGIDLVDFWCGQYLESYTPSTFINYLVNASRINTLYSTI
jgi:hypothetical protein